LRDHFRDCDLTTATETQVIEVCNKQFIVKNLYFNLKNTNYKYIITH
jgi:hypothetical protein